MCSVFKDIPFHSFSYSSFFTIFSRFSCAPIVIVAVLIYPLSSDLLYLFCVHRFLSAPCGGDKKCIKWPAFSNLNNGDECAKSK